MVISEIHISRKALKVPKTPCLPCFHAETSRSGEVAAFHNAGRDEYFRMGIMDLFQPARAFQVAVDDADFFNPVFFAHFAQNS